MTTNRPALHVGHTPPAFRDRIARRLYLLHQPNDPRYGIIRAANAFADHSRDYLEWSDADSLDLRDLASLAQIVDTADRDLGATFRAVMLPALTQAATVPTYAASARDNRVTDQGGCVDDTAYCRQCGDPLPDRPARPSEAFCDQSCISEYLDTDTSWETAR